MRTCRAARFSCGLSIACMNAEIVRHDLFRSSIIVSCRRIDTWPARRCRERRVQESITTPNPCPISSGRHPSFRPSSFPSLSKRQFLPSLTRSRLAGRFRTIGVARRSERAGPSRRRPYRQASQILVASLPISNCQSWPDTTSTGSMRARASGLSHSAGPTRRPISRPSRSISNVVGMPKMPSAPAASADESR